jgi:hypothetical protein
LTNILKQGQETIYTLRGNSYNNITRDNEWTSMVVSIPSSFLWDKLTMPKRIDVPLFFLNISHRIIGEISTGRGEIDNLKGRFFNA